MTRATREAASDLPSLERCDGRSFEAPFWHAPESARTIFAVTAVVALGPLSAGVVMFGWRALWVAILCVLSCTLIESAYFRITRAGALMGRSHAVLTGLLLALTLPAFVPWYVPVIASAFAIIVGKAVFGGVGHFLWQPALVGRVAVAVLLPSVLTVPSTGSPGRLPVLTQEKVITGDLDAARRHNGYRSWRGATSPIGADAVLVEPPAELLASLGGHTPGMLDKVLRPMGLRFSALAYPPEFPQVKPSLIQSLPPLSDVLQGACPGGLGETCGIVIIVAGLYLAYRNFIKWQLPVMFLLAAALVAAVAPVHLAGEQDAVQTVWLPLLAEGLDVGVVYVCYQLLSGSMLLCAFFLATEMTSRPVTAGGQAIFGLSAGAVAMLLRLNVDLPFSLDAYMAVLLLNTFTPVIDLLWRPRVLGTRWRNRFGT